METFLKIWEFLTLNIDNPVLATAVGLLFTYLGGTVLTKGIRITFMFLLYLVKVLQDKKIDDAEAVQLFWRVASVVYGFWPNASKKGKLLEYAPLHWHKLITTGEKPDFELLSVKKAPK